MLQILLVFFCGAIREASSVFWVHYSERSRPFITACIAILIASMEVMGIFASVRDLRIAPFFILGYGVGTFLAVKYKYLLR